MTHITQRCRHLKTARGKITFARDYLYFPELKTGIYPLDNRLHLPKGTMTPRVKRQLLEQLANDDYRASAQSLKVMSNSISPATAGCVLRQVGEEIQTELFGFEAMLQAAQTAPTNPAPLLILSTDGSRYRTNEADQRKTKQQPHSKKEPLIMNKKETSATKKKELSAKNELGTEILSTRERDRGWRENKIGIVTRAMNGYYDKKGQYCPPKELVKTYVATTEDIHVFGRLFRIEAERRGIDKAIQVIWIGDHGHGNPDMLKREFGAKTNFLQIITDFYHCSERLSDCAKAIYGEGKQSCSRRQNLYKQLRHWLWEGEVKKVIGKLRTVAKGLASQPSSLAPLEEQSNAKILWQHILYFEKYKDTMDYAVYRARGWPMGSGAVESSCGQIGDRVKHNRMRWTRKGAEALHIIKAAILSQDDRWSHRWPPPIPVLELPLAS